MELREDLYSLTESNALWARLPELCNAFLIGAQVDDVMRHGLLEPLTHRQFAPSDLTTTPGNHREGLVAGGLCSRHRAVLSCIEDVTEGPSGRAQCRIFSTEAVTAFAALLAGVFQHLVCSEYADSAAPTPLSRQVRIEDLTDLTFADESLDLVVTNDVLEHVWDLDRALSEMARVLAPGGWHVGTHPFNLGAQESLKRAVLRDGVVQHLLPPEYHGNPLSPEGSLVFEIPGWDVLARAKLAGFSAAFMRAVCSTRHGVFATHVAPVFVLMCRR